MNYFEEVKYMKKEDKMFWIALFILGTIFTGGALPIMIGAMYLANTGWKSWK